MSFADRSRDTGLNEQTSSQEVSSDLLAAIWSVISFERHEAGGLIYADALKKLDELERRGVVGLCVVTDHAAARVGGLKKLELQNDLPKTLI
jgi:hypothetical protein